MRRGRHQNMGPGRHLRYQGRHVATEPLVDRAVALLLILALFAVAVLAYGLIDNRWYRVLPVQGGSMQPAIDPGDAIVLVRPPERLSEGDVVTLQVEDRLVTHRVVRVDEDGSFSTMGDANDSADDWTGVEVRVTGRVAATIPWVGSLLGAFGTDAFFLDREAEPATVGSGNWQVEALDEDSQQAESPQA